MSTDRRIHRIEELDNEGVQELLRSCSMEEFIDFVIEKGIDGRKLMNVTEGIVKLWRPKINANKLIMFIQDVKNTPEKYDNFHSTEIRDSIIDDNGPKPNSVTKDTRDESIVNETIVEVIIEQETKTTIESQYQTVNKTKENTKTNEEYQTVKKSKDSHINFNNIEDLIKKIVPAKSFLYRNQEKKTENTSYLPMDAGTPKKRKMFRISAYDYPIFDMKRFSKPEGDRGYYPMKRNSRFFIQKTKSPESRTKYKSISTTEELKYPEDHFYEDLCYNDIESDKNSISNAQAKPYKVKIQELFQSFKMPFFKKSEEGEKVCEEEKKLERRIVVDEKEHVYENSDSMINMYDSVHVHSVDEGVKEIIKTKLPVEDYLEPVQLSKDYCDVKYKQKDESLLGYIMSIFETRFGYRRETNDAQIEDSEPESPTEKWAIDAPHHMADRPLPVPVENEPYYMDIDRHEAENLLRGQPDGTFVLRPSSQSSHAYTLSVSCASSVHNVGVRRRPDGRLALGYARKGERSFADVTSLLRHHKKRRLLLVANGGVIGATTLNESPQYYQTPCSLPVKII